MKVDQIKAGYMELPGAKKDTQCSIVEVPGGVSSDLGCCNLFRPHTGVKLFSCGTCKYVSEYKGEKGEQLPLKMNRETGIPTVLLVRHARTELNDPANEKIRGYSDVPISFEGKEGLKRTAEYLKNSGFALTQILASPLQRTQMSAQTIAEPFGAKVIPNQGLLPWNLGKLSGTPVAIAAKKMDYLQAYPDIKAPGGESYGDFYGRWAEALEKMFVYSEAHPSEVVVGVVHSRNLLALDSILGSRDMGDVPVKGGPEPESVTQLTFDGSGWMKKVIWEGK